MRFRKYGGCKNRHVIVSSPLVVSLAQATPPTVIADHHVWSAISPQTLVWESGGYTCGHDRFLFADLILLLRKPANWRTHLSSFAY
jgi:hypothetical protein